MWLSKSAQNPICSISSHLGINAAWRGKEKKKKKEKEKKEGGLADCPENYKWLQTKYR